MALEAYRQHIRIGWGTEEETVDQTRAGSRCARSSDTETWDRPVCELRFGRRVDQGPLQRAIRSEVPSD